MKKLNYEEIEKQSREARKLVVETVNYAGAGHIGGPMSAIDILTTLYFRQMNIDSDSPDKGDRDRFVLSKGHSAIGLYCVLALRGYFPIEELKTFDQLNSRLQAHPDMTLLPGLEMSTGSLGQGISAALGMAMGSKLQGINNTVYCMIGDGESQEGQVWEAAEIAAKYNLDNFVVILDNNKLQQYGWNAGEGSRSVPDLNPADKWKAFGWHTVEVDGHNIEDLDQAFEQLKSVEDVPKIIIANTVKGKGVDFMEGNYLWHSNVPTDEELKEALLQLERN
ncbi:transketolase [Corticicoccus populi]|uniref:Transketolase n=1 Tax=Corticicoccus populi TaxID=1812821 RepID=A0ABW5WWH4_9STAP